MMTKSDKVEGLGKKMEATISTIRVSTESNECCSLGCSGLELWDPEEGDGGMCRYFDDPDGKHIGTRLRVVHIKKNTYPVRCYQCIAKATKVPK